MSVIERLLRRDDDVTSIETTGGAVVIEEMKRRDLRHGVLEIEEVSYPRTWSRSVFESELAQVRSGSRYYLVARRHPEDRGRRRSPISGYAGLWFVDGDGHVTNVAVDPAQQRTGIASALMLALAEETIRRNATAWTLEVRSSSLGAQELYRRFGFVPAGVRKRYYENTEDAIVMWCNDIQTDDYRALLDDVRAGLATEEAG